MSGEDIVIAIIIGLFAGWLVEMIAPHNGLGIVGNLTMTIVGAGAGVGLLPLVGVHLGQGIITPVLEGGFGAALTLFLMKLLRPDQMGDVGKPRRK